MVSPPVSPSPRRAALLATARNAQRQGQVPAAIAACRQLLALDPRDAEAALIVGQLALMSGRPGDALPALQQALQHAPNHPLVIAELARALAGMQRFGDALTLSARLPPAAIHDATVADRLGLVHSRAERHDLAAAYYRRAIALQPAVALRHFNLADALIALGEFAPAEQALEACLRVDLRHWAAHGVLARLRRWSERDHHLDRLQRLLDEPDLPAEARLQLQMARHKELEDLGREDEAFAALVAGKSAQRAALRYAFSEDAALFDAVETAWRSVPLADADRTDPLAPVFVFGLPRTGTTLVDRILSSHPRLRSVGESQRIATLVKRSAATPGGRAYDAQTLAASPQVASRALGSTFLASLALPGDTRRIIDKTPMNFLHAATIVQALPGARLICLRRNPLDSCLSNLRQPFAPNNRLHGYSYDLLDCGRYYLRFERLMRMWQRLMPGRILDVHYESLVDDLPAATARMLAHCGLAWDDACLRFDRNRQSVSTASAVQVRQPLYRTSIGRWQRYRPQLQPLIELLQAGGVDPFGMPGD